MFRRKILLQSALMMTAAFAAIAWLYLFVWRGNVGDRLVRLFRSAFGMSRDGALRLYHFVFRENFNIFFLGAVAVVFFILLGLFLRRFTRYFDSINGGIDALIDDDGSEIELPPEMAAVEGKLNTVRLTLERRARETRLAERRKNDLVLYLAHDIRTPLTSVIGYLSLLDESPDLPAAQRAKHVRVALDKAHRLERLTDEFFEIARFHSGAIELSKETIDLYYMLLQICDEFYPQTSARGNRIRIRADEDLTVCGDPDKLARVFNNILKNAAAYSDENSEIEIAAGLSGDTVSVVFTNSGAIPRDKLSVIFEKFRRLDGARPTGTGGAGLGLAIAKEIVVLHGGNIFAESRDNRTTFTVELPAGPGIADPPAPDGRNRATQNKP
ncbi:MAG: HAMP domain-containing histidine kinase [Clostridiales Family XIII bacterium]|nr:HAMP domain-containing histidine kinase [Clostridiales Family XIII bacterium]